MPDQTAKLQRLRQILLSPDLRPFVDMNADPIDNAINVIALLLRVAYPVRSDRSVADRISLEKSFDNARRAAAVALRKASIEDAGEEPDPVKLDRAALDYARAWIEGSERPDWRWSGFCYGVRVRTSEGMQLAKDGKRVLRFRKNGAFDA